MLERMNFYIITGGPGSGKTTIIEALKERGILCIDEVGRQIIQEQVRIDGDALHSKNQIKFRDLMLSRSIYLYEQVTEKESPIFFDRGIPELIGYCSLIKADIPDYIRNASRLYRYNQKVFITPPWKEIYQHDIERKQTWEEAVETYHFVADSYLEEGYQLIEIPQGTVSDRVNFILKHIDKQALIS